jgi:hypothetical protein
LLPVAVFPRPLERAAHPRKFTGRMHERRVNRIEGVLAARVLTPVHRGSSGALIEAVATDRPGEEAKTAATALTPLSRSGRLA